MNYIEFPGKGGNDYRVRIASIYALVRKMAVYGNVTDAPSGEVRDLKRPAFAVFFGGISDAITEETYHYIKEVVFDE